MRSSAVADCVRILNHFDIDPSALNAIDVGGTEIVYLDKAFARNPLLDLSPELTFLDRGFNVELTASKVDVKVDFLDFKAISCMQEHFNLVYCFDTLEHVSNPFLFCKHLIFITKPGGYIYLTTVFEWPYHPSPEDNFRFSPNGLRTLFEESFNELGSEFCILWCGWESDSRRVSLFGQRYSSTGSTGYRKHEESPYITIDELIASRKRAILEVKSQEHNSSAREIHPILKLGQMINLVLQPFGFRIVRTYRKD